MKSINYFKNTALVLLIIGGFLLILFSVAALLQFCLGINFLGVELAQSYGTLIGGLIGVIVSVSTALLLFSTLKAQTTQNFENNLFQFINNHNASRPYCPLLNPPGTGSYLDFFQSLKEFKGKKDEKIELDILHYMIKLNFIINFINKDYHGKEERGNYYKLFLYQISYYELLFLTKINSDLKQEDSKKIYPFKNDQLQKEIGSFCKNCSNELTEIKFPESQD